MRDREEQPCGEPLTYPGGKVRLYVEAPLAAGSEIAFAPGQAHYLLHVMRAREGARVQLFNGRDGEWTAALRQPAKKNLSAVCERRARPQSPAPDVWLLFAPLKRAPIDFLAQKATELGAARLQPVITRRTVAARVNLDRLRANAVEAAEQSGRLDVPLVTSPEDLMHLLSRWDEGRTLVFCDEGGEAEPVAAALRRTRPGGPAAVLVGPEGGFDPAEREMIRKLSVSVPVSLGPRLVRADTAALAALAVWQSACGDWS